MANKNEKKSFVMYDSFLEAMKHLNDKDFRECVLKIRDYALEGVDKEGSSPMVNVIMAMAKPNLDSAKRRYIASVENGKKGAEFGKLGGAPKGNQNARKKQPLKQPLDVDANVDVEEDVNENEEVNVEVDADVPSGSIGFQSSFSNSLIGFQEEIENDSERLEEKEETKEPHSEVRPSSSNDLEVNVASEGKGKIPIYSNSHNSNSTSSPCFDEGAGSSARPRQQKESGMSIDEYHQMCFEKNIDKLVLMRLGKIPNDDTLFWRTVKLYKLIFRDNDEQIAVKALHQVIKELCTDLN